MYSDSNNRSTEEEEGASAPPRTVALAPPLDNSNSTPQQLEQALMALRTAIVSSIQQQQRDGSEAVVASLPQFPSTVTGLEGGGGGDGSPSAPTTADEQQRPRAAMPPPIIGIHQRDAASTTITVGAHTHAQQPAALLDDGVAVGVPNGSFSIDVNSGGVVAIGEGASVPMIGGKGGLTPRSSRGGGGGVGDAGRLSARYRPAPHHHNNTTATTNSSSTGSTNVGGLPAASSSATGPTTISSTSGGGGEGPAPATPALLSSVALTNSNLNARGGGGGVEGGTAGHHHSNNNPNNTNTDGSIESSLSVLALHMSSHTHVPSANRSDSGGCWNGVHDDSHATACVLRDEGEAVGGSANSTSPRAHANGSGSCIGGLGGLKKSDAAAAAATNTTASPTGPARGIIGGGGGGIHTAFRHHPAYEGIPLIVMANSEDDTASSTRTSSYQRTQSGSLIAAPTAPTTVVPSPMVVQSASSSAIVVVEGTPAVPTVISVTAPQRSGEEGRGRGSTNSSMEAPPAISVSAAGGSIHSQNSSHSVVGGEAAALLEGTMAPVAITAAPTTTTTTGNGRRAEAYAYDGIRPMLEVTGAEEEEGVDGGSCDANAAAAGGPNAPSAAVGALLLATNSPASLSAATMGGGGGSGTIPLAAVANSSFSHVSMRSVSVTMAPPATAVDGEDDMLTNIQPILRDQKQRAASVTAEGVVGCATITVTATDSHEDHHSIAAMDGMATIDQGGGERRRSAERELPVATPAAAVVVVDGATSGPSAGGSGEGAASVADAQSGGGAAHYYPSGLLMGGASFDHHSHSHHRVSLDSQQSQQGFGTGAFGARTESRAMSEVSLLTRHQTVTTNNNTLSASSSAATHSNPTATGTSTHLLLGSTHTTTTDGSSGSYGGGSGSPINTTVGYYGAAKAGQQDDGTGAGGAIERGGSTSANFGQQGSSAHATTPAASSFASALMHPATSFTTGNTIHDQPPTITTTGSGSEGGTLGNARHTTSMSSAASPNANQHLLSAPSLTANNSSSLLGATVHESALDRLIRSRSGLVSSTVSARVKTVTSSNNRLLQQQIDQNNQQQQQQQLGGSTLLGAGNPNTTCISLTQSGGSQSPSSNKLALLAGSSGSMSHHHPSQSSPPAQQMVGIVIDASGFPANQPPPTRVDSTSTTTGDANSSFAGSNHGNYVDLGGSSLGKNRTDTMMTVGTSASGVGGLGLGPTYQSVYSEVSGRISSVIGNDRHKNGSSKISANNNSGSDGIRQRIPSLPSRAGHRPSSSTPPRGGGAGSFPLPVAPTVAAATAATAAAAAALLGGGGGAAPSAAMNPAELLAALNRIEGLLGMPLTKVAPADAAAGGGSSSQRSSPSPSRSNTTRHHNQNGGFELHSVPKTTSINHSRGADAAETPPHGAKSSSHSNSAASGFGGGHNPSSIRGAINSGGSAVMSIPDDAAGEGSGKSPSSAVASGNGNGLVNVLSSPQVLASSATSVVLEVDEDESPATPLTTRRNNAAAAASRAESSAAADGAAVGTITVAIPDEPLAALVAVAAASTTTMSATIVPASPKKGTASADGGHRGSDGDGELVSATNASGVDDGANNKDGGSTSTLMAKRVESALTNPSASPAASPTSRLLAGVGAFAFPTAPPQRTSSNLQAASLLSGSTNTNANMGLMGGAHYSTAIGSANSVLNLGALASHLAGGGAAGAAGAGGGKGLLIGEGGRTASNRAPSVNNSSAPSKDNTHNQAPSSARLDGSASGLNIVVGGGGGGGVSSPLRGLAARVAATANAASAPLTPIGGPNATPLGSSSEQHPTLPPPTVGLSDGSPRPSQPLFGVVVDASASKSASGSAAPRTMAPSTSDANLVHLHGSHPQQGSDAVEAAGCSGFNSFDARGQSPTHGPLQAHPSDVGGSGGGATILRTISLSTAHNAPKSTAHHLNSNVDGPDFTTMISGLLDPIATDGTRLLGPNTISFHPTMVADAAGGVSGLGLMMATVGTDAINETSAVAANGGQPFGKVNSSKKRRAGSGGGGAGSPAVVGGFGTKLVGIRNTNNNAINKNSPQKDAAGAGGGAKMPRVQSNFTIGDESPYEDSFLEGSQGRGGDDDGEGEEEGTDLANAIKDNTSATNDFGNEEVAQWLIETYCDEKKREDNGFNLKLKKRESSRKRILSKNQSNKSLGGANGGAAGGGFSARQSRRTSIASSAFGGGGGSVPGTSRRSTVHRVRLPSHGNRRASMAFATSDTDLLGAASSVGGDESGTENGGSVLLGDDTLEGFYDEDDYDDDDDEEHLVRGGTPSSPSEGPATAIFSFESIQKGPAGSSSTLAADGQQQQLSSGTTAPSSLSSPIIKGNLKRHDSPTRGRPLPDIGGGGDDSSGGAPTLGSTVDGDGESTSFTPHIHIGAGANKVDIGSIPGVNMHPHLHASGGHAKAGGGGGVGGAARRVSIQVPLDHVEPSPQGGGAAGGGSRLLVAEQSSTTRYRRTNQRTYNSFCSVRALSNRLRSVGIPLLAKVNDADFNIFDVFAIHKEETLTVIAVNIFFQYQFMKSLEVDYGKFVNFCRTVESCYRYDNPYHNAVHAADVLQTTNVFLCVGNVRENFSDVELFAVLFAALIHDVGHVGVDNNFLIKSRHPIARLYNDRSPMESMHSAYALTILERPHCNFLSESTTWTNQLYDDFRGLVAEVVRGTDMKFHNELTTAAAEVLEDGHIDDNEVGVLLKSIVHAADLSNAMKPTHIYVQWVDRVIGEFWRQGDEEKRLGLPISLLCDRTGTNVGKSQVGFINFVVNPFMTVLAPVLPSIWMTRLSSNLEYMRSLSGEDEATRISNVEVFANAAWRNPSHSEPKAFVSVLRDEIATMDLPAVGTLTTPAAAAAWRRKAEEEKAQQQAQAAKDKEGNKAGGSGLQSADSTVNAAPPTATGGMQSKAPSWQQRSFFSNDTINGGGGGGGASDGTTLQHSSSNPFAASGGGGGSGASPFVNTFNYYGAYNAATATNTVGASANTTAAHSVATNTMSNTSFFNSVSGTNSFAARPQGGRASLPFASSVSSVGGGYGGYGVGGTALSYSNSVAGTATTTGGMSFPTTPSATSLANNGGGGGVGPFVVGQQQQQLYPLPPAAMGSNTAGMGSNNSNSNSLPASHVVAGLAMCTALQSILREAVSRQEGGGQGGGGNTAAAGPFLGHEGDLSDLLLAGAHVREEPTTPSPSCAPSPATVTPPPSSADGGVSSPDAVAKTEVDQPPTASDYRTTSTAAAAVVGGARDGRRGSLVIRRKKDHTAAAAADAPIITVFAASSAAGAAARGDSSSADAGAGSSGSGTNLLLKGLDEATRRNTVAYSDNEGDADEGDADGGANGDDDRSPHSNSSPNAADGKESQLTIPSPISISSPLNKAAAAPPSAVSSSSSLSLSSTAVMRIAASAHAIVRTIPCLADAMAMMPTSDPSSPSPSPNVLAAVLKSSAAPSDAPIASHYPDEQWRVYGIGGVFGMRMAEALQQMKARQQVVDGGDASPSSPPPSSPSLVLLSSQFAWVQLALGLECDRIADSVLAYVTCPTLHYSGEAVAYATASLPQPPPSGGWGASASGGGGGSGRQHTTTSNVNKRTSVVILPRVDSLPDRVTNSTSPIMGARSPVSARGAAGGGAVAPSVSEGGGGGGTGPIMIHPVSSASINSYSNHPLDAARQPAVNEGLGNSPALSGTSKPPLSTSDANNTNNNPSSVATTTASTMIPLHQPSASTPTAAAAPAATAGVVGATMTPLHQHVLSYAMHELLNPTMSYLVGAANTNTAVGGSSGHSGGSLLLLEDGDKGGLGIKAFVLKQLLPLVTVLREATLRIIMSTAAGGGGGGAFNGNAGTVAPPPAVVKGATATSGATPPSISQTSSTGSLKGGNANAGHHPSIVSSSHHQQFVAAALLDQHALKCRRLVCELISGDLYGTAMGGLAKGTAAAVLLGGSASNGATPRTEGGDANTDNNSSVGGLLGVMTATAVRRGTAAPAPDGGDGEGSVGLVDGAAAAPTLPLPPIADRGDASASSQQSAAASSLFAAGPPPAYRAAVGDVFAALMGGHASPSAPSRCDALSQMASTLWWAGAAEAYTRHCSAAAKDASKEEGTVIAVPPVRAVDGNGAAAPQQQLGCASPITPPSDEALAAAEMFISAIDELPPPPSASVVCGGTTSSVPTVSPATTTMTATATPTPATITAVPPTSTGGGDSMIRTAEMDGLRAALAARDAEIQRLAALLATALEQGKGEQRHGGASGGEEALPAMLAASSNGINSSAPVPTDDGSTSQIVVVVPTTNGIAGLQIVPPPPPSSNSASLSLGGVVSPHCMSLGNGLHHHQHRSIAHQHFEGGTPMSMGGGDASSVFISKDQQLQSGSTFNIAGLLLPSTPLGGISATAAAVGGGGRSIVPPNASYASAGLVSTATPMSEGSRGFVDSDRAPIPDRPARQATPIEDPIAPRLANDPEAMLVNNPLHPDGTVLGHNGGLPFYLPSSHGHGGAVGAPNAQQRQASAGASNANASSSSSGLGLGGAGDVKVVMLTSKAVRRSMDGAPSVSSPSIVGGGTASTDALSPLSAISSAGPTSKSTNVGLLARADTTLHPPTAQQQQQQSLAQWPSTTSVAGGGAEVADADVDGNAGGSPMAATLQPTRGVDLLGGGLPHAPVAVAAPAAAAALGGGKARAASLGTGTGMFLGANYYGAGSTELSEAHDDNSFLSSLGAPTTPHLVGSVGGAAAAVSSVQRLSTILGLAETATAKSTAALSAGADAEITPLNTPSVTLGPASTHPQAAHQHHGGRTTGNNGPSGAMLPPSAAAMTMARLPTVGSTDSFVTTPLPNGRPPQHPPPQPHGQQASPTSVTTTVSAPSAAVTPTRAPFPRLTSPYSKLGALRTMPPTAMLPGGSNASVGSNNAMINSPLAPLRQTIGGGPTTTNASLLVMGPSPVTPLRATYNPHLQQLTTPSGASTQSSVGAPLLLPQILSTNTLCSPLGVPPATKRSGGGGGAATSLVPLHRVVLQSPSSLSTTTPLSRKEVGDSGGHSAAGRGAAAPQTNVLSAHSGGAGSLSPQSPIAARKRLPISTVNATVAHLLKEQQLLSGGGVGGFVVLPNPIDSTSKSTSMNSGGQLVSPLVPPILGEGSGAVGGGGPTVMIPTTACSSNTSSIPTNNGGSIFGAYAGISFRSGGGVLGGGMGGIASGPPPPLVVGATPSPHPPLTDDPPLPSKALLAAPSAEEGGDASDAVVKPYPLTAYWLSPPRERERDASSTALPSSSADSKGVGPSFPRYSFDTATQQLTPNPNSNTLQPVLGSVSGTTKSFLASSAPHPSSSSSTMMAGGGNSVAAMASRGVGIADPSKRLLWDTHHL